MKPTLLIFPVFAVSIGCGSLIRGFSGSSYASPATASPAETSPATQSSFRQAAGTPQAQGSSVQGEGVWSDQRFSAAMSPTGFGIDRKATRLYVPITLLTSYRGDTPRPMTGRDRLPPNVTIEVVANGKTFASSWNEYVDNHSAVLISGVKLGDSLTAVVEMAGTALAKQTVTVGRSHAWTKAGELESRFVIDMSALQNKVWGGGPDEQDPVYVHRYTMAREEPMGVVWLKGGQPIGFAEVQDRSYMRLGKVAPSIDFPDAFDYFEPLYLVNGEQADAGILVVRENPDDYRIVGMFTRPKKQAWSEISRDASLTVTPAMRQFMGDWRRTSATNSKDKLAREQMACALRTSSKMRELKAALVYMERKLAVSSGAAEELDQRHKYELMDPSEREKIAARQRSFEADAESHWSSVESLKNAIDKEQRKFKAGCYQRLTTP